MKTIRFHIKPPETFTVLNSKTRPLLIYCPKLAEGYWGFDSLSTWVSYTRFFEYPFCIYNLRYNVEFSSYSVGRRVNFDRQSITIRLKKNKTHIYNKPSVQRRPPWRLFKENVISKQSVTSFTYAQMLNSINWNYFSYRNTFYCTHNSISTVCLL